jgi:hypothetical protein
MRFTVHEVLMRRYLWLSCALALSTTGCDSTTFTLTIPVYATVQFPGSQDVEGFDEVPSVDLGDMMSLGLMDNEDLATWGVEPKHLASARVAWLQLEALEGNLAFLESAYVRLDSDEFLSEPIASRSDFPAGIISAGLDLEDVDLLPYITDTEEATLTANAIGTLPEERTVVNLFGGMSVEVTLNGILSQMTN